ncbi:MAG: glycosyltransferase family 4 protein [Proteobacteria bacterium]|nr:glycosyltransferase family 4 protein [Pseudomonadota bacterium]
MTFRVAAPWRTPIFQWLGGDHPMMTSLLAPRAGYEFLLDLPVPDAGHRATAAAERDALVAELVAALPGISREAIVQFAESRDLESQAQIAAAAPDLTLPHSMPFVYGQRPWISHIEELMTLFAPFLWHGKTANVDVRSMPVWHLVRAMLESDRCRAVSSHLRHSHEFIGKLFDSPKIQAKSHYIPFGVAFPPEIQARIDAAQAARETRGGCTFLFTNSWGQHDESFVLRGGMETLAAFGTLVARRPDCRLILRTQIPKLFGPDFEKFVRGIPNIEIVDTRLGFGEFIDLFLRADVFLIPSCGLHTVSLLQAMACGAATIASDAPAVDEFVTDGETGIAVKGRLGRTAWYDQWGFLNQTFEPMMKSYDAAFSENLHASMDELARDRVRRLALSRAGRAHVARHHAIGPWIDGFGQILDQVRAGL